MLGLGLSDIRSFGGNATGALQPLSARWIQLTMCAEVEV
jgi:hypothetical protein